MKNIGHPREWDDTKNYVRMQWTMLQYDNIRLQFLNHRLTSLRLAVRSVVKKTAHDWFDL